MKESFYKILEDTHRGSRALIKERLNVYVEPVSLLKNAKNKHPKALDLGCGRGEWLELLKENGFHAKGIDLEESMIFLCQTQGLDVEKIDAIAYLKNLPEESLDLISGFHIAEHLPFDTLQEMVALCYAVLKPGGLLILETPNPENISVASKFFHMDPTHHHPLPPELLTLVAHYHGFLHVKVLRLQEPKGIAEKNVLGILDILTGVSPDYSVVAQKKGSPHTLKKFQPFFDKEYGVTLEKLAHTYDDRHESLTMNLYKHIEWLETLVNNLQSEKQQIVTEKQQIVTEKQILQEEYHTLHTQYLAIQNSLSWRITKPLRRTKQVLRQWRIKLLLKKILLRIKNKLQKHPFIKNSIKKIIMRFPSLYTKLKYLSINETLTQRPDPMLSESEEVILHDLAKTIHSQKVQH